MIPDWDVLVLLLAAAGVAGWIDAVIGGGGLVLIPALLIAFPGAPPASALGTNKLAAIWGQAPRPSPTRGSPPSRAAWH